MEGVGSLTIEIKISVDCMGNLNPPGDFFDLSAISGAGKFTDLRSNFSAEETGGEDFSSSRFA
jgi:hypothetical protein